MGRFDAVYNRLPFWAQHGAVSTYGIYWYWLRFGPHYGQYLRGYLERERFSLIEWKTWQQERLRDLLSLAVSQVPHYRNTWTGKEREAALAGSLKDLPLLEKESLRRDPRAFLRQDKKPWPNLIFHTSGSTGTPIKNYWTKEELRNSMALREARSARWGGVSFRMPRATFSGRLVESDPESKGPYYRYNLVESQVYLSAFHLKPDTARYYLEGIHKHHIQWLTGYAVSYYLLAKMILEQGLDVPPLKAIITTSEKLTPQMRHVMEDAYKCKVYEEYSTVENVIFASECEHGRLHNSPDVAVVEILDSQGRPCEPGKVGEVVATSLLRKYQPFIRYRLGDLAKWDPEPCPCGRTMPVIKEVLGRVEDVVIGPDGRQMVRFHGIFVDQPNIREGQIIQESFDHIRAKVVPTKDFGHADIEDITKRIQQRLGPMVMVTVEAADHIPRTAAGKFQAVVSLLREQG